MKKTFLLLCLITLYNGLSQTKTAYEKEKNEAQRYKDDDLYENLANDTDLLSLETSPNFNERLILPKQKEDSSYFKIYEGTKYTKNKGKAFKEEWYTKYSDTINCEDFWDIIFSLQGKKQL